MHRVLLVSFVLPVGPHRLLDLGIPILWSFDDRSFIARAVVSSVK
jgi:hypothetical protein